MFLIYDEGCYARHIARELRVDRYYPNTGKLIQPKNYRRNPRRELTVDVNWGVGPRMLDAARARLRRRGDVLNACISASVLKMRTFELIDVWNKEEGRRQITHPVVVRDPKEIVTIKGKTAPFYMRGKYLARKDGLSGGAGIDIYEAGALPDADKKYDFYSLMVSKEHEVRIHVAGGNVICEQVKYMPQGAVHPIRNYDNGARFSNKNIENVLDPVTAATARTMAIDTAAALGLNFGAVDVMISRNGTVYAIEFNSAPGITPGEDEREPRWDQPSTFEAYKNFFAGYLV